MQQRTPGATGWHFGAMPPKSLLVPPFKREMFHPSKDCAPKKVKGLLPLECSSGPETPKIQSIREQKPFFCSSLDENPLFFVFTLEFVELRAYFAIKTFFMVFTVEFGRIVFGAIQKIAYAPQSRYSGAGRATT